jgi:serine/threonine protein kinase
MTEQEVRDILPQILDALKSVHAAGIWHLDLKPANIMVDKNGNVKLIDFGASKQLNAQKGGATTSTAISYTNGYAPREQMEQNYDKFGPWTDIYALGATLYNLLTNKRPPLPTDIDDDMSEDKHIALPFPEGVSDEMKSCVLWMMKTNRLQRPQSIDAIINAEKDRKATPSTSTTLHSSTSRVNTDDEETIIAEPQPKGAGRKILR